MTSDAHPKFNPAGYSDSKPTTIVGYIILGFMRTHFDQIFDIEGKTLAGQGFPMSQMLIFGRAA